MILALLGYLTMFGQSFDYRDLATIALLIVLEGVLSIDNALVLGILARRVQPSSRLRVLWYGLAGAFALRLAAVALAAYLLRWSFLKLLGGIYLLYVSVRYFQNRSRRRGLGVEGTGELPAFSGLWRTVAAIELTDVAFAVDSILAAVALVGGPPSGTPPGAIHPKLWVIVTGGMLGLVLMRFAAAVFMRLLERFPALNASAYLLVLLIGLKLLIDYAVNTPAHPNRVDFQNPAAWPFWVFWMLMAACLATGFMRRRHVPPALSPAERDRLRSRRWDQV